MKIISKFSINHAMYDRIKKEANDGNRTCMIAFPGVALVAMLFCLILSFSQEAMVPSRMLYLCTGLLCFCLSLINVTVAKEYPMLTMITMYVFIFILLGVGILMGTVTNKTEQTTTFMVLMVVVPLLFTDRPLRMNFAIIIADLIYIISAAMTQDEILFSKNMVNAIVYGMVSVVVSSYMMRIKAERIAVNLENKYLSEVDQLTGLLNRRCYEERLSVIRENSISSIYAVVACDINGLKVVNDTKGHTVGDELIKGASDCIHSVFGNYGFCYRTGGDEFVVILDRDYGNADRFQREVEQYNADWNGRHKVVVGISYGIAETKEMPEATIDELIVLADQRMYQQKYKYYQQKGTDRRGRRVGQESAKIEN